MFSSALSVYPCIGVGVGRWYHGLISRQDAEALLKGKDTGVFLVRESTNYRGDFTLCVVSPTRHVEHYHILQKSNRLTIDEDDYFDNLTLLVQVGRRSPSHRCSLAGLHALSLGL
jgi:c-src tyrosine kinase